MLYTTASGVLLPAIVVAVHPCIAAKAEQPETCNLQVFTDESLPNLLHISDVEQSGVSESGKFHFAADEPKNKPAKETPAKVDKKTAGKGEE